MITRLLIAASVFWAAPAIALDSVTLGVPEFPERLSILESRSAIAEYVRAATTSALVQAGQPVKFELADGMSVSSDYKEWAFHIAPSAKFYNGRTVLPADVEFSLRRCQQNGLLGEVSSTRSESRKSRSLGSEQWVVVSLGSNADPHIFPDRLAKCPIVERASSSLFGAQLGFGSNYVAVGDYSIVDFRVGHEYTLQRSPLDSSLRSKRLRSAPLNLVFRGFRDEESALTALRVGTIDAFLSVQEGIISKAEKDETLSIRKCSQYTQVLRRGLSINCPEQFIAADVQYVG
ncbi:MAG: hypothetical protein K1X79_01970 [Oligoflexia bacterium]|nr:hypothetical protein [Oligoflexia bacterium]